MRKPAGTFLAFALVIASASAQGINSQLISTAERQDLQSLISLYANDAVLFPEFHPPVYGITAIEEYYRNRFAHARISQYSRTIRDSKQYGEHVVETGTLAYQFTVNDKSPVKYDGSYLIVWKTDRHEQPRILFEIWGSDKGIDRAATELPLEKRVRRKQEPKTSADPSVEQAIVSRTQEIEAAVKKRDGLTLAQLYTKDAIYIPYYSPMMDGIDMIRDYYVKHEDPNVAIDSVHIRLTGFLLVENIVITTGEYGVRWRAGEHTGKVTGKNLNIWRREKDGKYYLFRQMANHD